MIHTDGLEVLSFPSQEAWDAWLAAEHERRKGVWLRLAKQRGIDSLTYQQAVDVALCHGWIDGQKAAFDNESWLQRFTPRRGGSKWSRINTERAERLIAEGRMKPAGLRQVELAKADGRWQAAYDGQRTADVPPDLRAALQASPAAAALFERLNSTNRYAILYRVHDAKRPETRTARIKKFVAMLERGETPYPLVASRRAAGSPANPESQ